MQIAVYLLALAAANPALGASEGLLTTLANASYSGIYETPVPLNDGRFEGTPYMPGGASAPSLTLVPGLITRADLDGDGTDEAAVVLVESSGGTGAFVYLAAMAVDAGAATNLGTVLLGDRVQIRSLAAVPGGVLVETLSAEGDDASAQPTHKLRRVFTLGPDGLKESSAEAGGVLSLADLEGTEWQLREVRAAEPLHLQDIQITAAFGDQRISGHAGCNRYSASLTDEGRGRIAVGPVGATRSACPAPQMTVEQAYLGLLAQVEWFGFGLGELMLGTPEGVLVLNPAPPSGNTP
jgi:heat shock protein HslJ